jgi:hypothetical protein
MEQGVIQMPEAMLSLIPTTGGTEDKTMESTNKQGGEQKKDDTTLKVDNKTNQQGQQKQEPKLGEDNKDDNQLSDEQIQSKLDELADKDETTLSDEDKQFIEKYTGEQADEITSAKSVLEQKFGIKIEDKLENTQEGLITLAEKAAEQRSKQLLMNYFDSVPYMKDFYNHVIVEKRGIETFLEKNQQPVYKNFKIEQITDTHDDTAKAKITDSYKQVVKLDYASKGIDDDTIKTLIELHEDKGTLFEEAKKAFNNLDTKHKAGIDAKLKAEQALIQKREDDSKKVIAELSNIIDKNDFNGLSIPPTELKAFKDAVLRPVDEQGHTLLDYKAAKITLAQQAILDYIIFKDFKVTGLTNTTASNKRFTYKKANEENNDRSLKMNGGKEDKRSSNNSNFNGMKPDIKQLILQQ